MRKRGAAAWPKVDGDPTSRKLWVRGTTSQVAQVRELVEKLEGTDASAGSSLGDNIRVIPFSGSGAETALDNAQTLWPALRTNRIRTVTPSAISPTLRERRTSTSDEPAADDDLRFQRPAGPAASRPRVLPTDRPAGPSAQVTGVLPVFVSWTEESPPAQAPEAPPANRPLRLPHPNRHLRLRRPPHLNRRCVEGLPHPNRHLRRRRHPPRRLFPAAQPAEAGATPEPTAPPSAETQPPASQPAAPTDQSPSDVPRTTVEIPKPPSDIIISRTPSGLVIASQDREALDEFEALLRSLMEQSQTSGEPTIFWLKFAKADVAAEILKQILGGTSSGDGGLGGRCCPECARQCRGWHHR